MSTCSAKSGDVTSFSTVPQSSNDLPSTGCKDIGSIGLVGAEERAQEGGFGPVGVTTLTPMGLPDTFTAFQYHQTADGIQGRVVAPTSTRESVC
jgi:hypothetical protein